MFNNIYNITLFSHHFILTLQCFLCILSWYHPEALLDKGCHCSMSFTLMSYSCCLINEFEGSCVSENKLTDLLPMKIAWKQVCVFRIKISYWLSIEGISGVIPNLACVHHDVIKTTWTTYIRWPDAQWEPPAGGNICTGCCTLNLGHDLKYLKCLTDWFWGEPRHHGKRDEINVIIWNNSQWAKHEHHGYNSNDVLVFTQTFIKLTTSSIEWCVIKCMFPLVGKMQIWNFKQNKSFYYYSIENSIEKTRLSAVVAHSWTSDTSVNTFLPVRHPLRYIENVISLLILIVH